MVFLWVSGFVKGSVRKPCIQAVDENVDEEGKGGVVGAGFPDGSIQGVSPGLPMHMIAAQEVIEVFRGVLA